MQLTIDATSGPRTGNKRIDRMLDELDTTWAVRDLSVTCEGADWSRELRMTRDQDGGWSCRTEESGDLGARPAGDGHPGQGGGGPGPPAGVHPARHRR